MRELLLLISIWLVACCPSWAGDQQGRFFEDQLENQTISFDLQTVQFVSPGRFTIIFTTIDNPDVMRFELNTLTTLRNYCKRPNGKYSAPSDLFQLGQTDLPVQQIEVTTNKEGNNKGAFWMYPYRRLKGGSSYLRCEETGSTEADLFELAYKHITNGYQSKRLYDCKRGLSGDFMDENEDASKAYTNPVRKDTNGGYWYWNVCRAVTHEEPYLPE
jgi:hypothetical protein